MEHDSYQRWPKPGSFPDFAMKKSRQQSPCSSLYSSRRPANSTEAGMDFADKNQKQDCKIRG
jgi:hypothetical protein